MKKDTKVELTEEKVREIVREEIAALEAAKLAAVIKPLAEKAGRLRAELDSLLKQL